MLSPLNRVVVVIAVVVLGAAVLLGVRLTDREDAATLGHLPLPAQGSLTQALDLNRIASFHYVTDSVLEVIDDSGKKYNMEFTEACPGLKDATDFSLVTESYRDMDRFTGIGLRGRICTFKDFSPRT